MHRVVFVPAIRLTGSYDEILIRKPHRFLLLNPGSSLWRLKQLGAYTKELLNTLQWPFRIFFGGDGDGRLIFLAEDASE